MVLENHLHIKQNLFGIGMITTTNGDRLRYINTKRTFGKLLVKIAAILARIFPKLNRVQFAPNDFRGGEAAFSIRRTRLEAFIENACYGPFQGKAAPSSLIIAVKKQFAAPTGAPQQFTDYLRALSVKIEELSAAYFKQQTPSPTSPVEAAKPPEKKELPKHQKQAPAFPVKRHPLFRMKANTPDLYPYIQLAVFQNDYHKLLKETAVSTQGQKEGFSLHQCFKDIATAPEKKAKQALGLAVRTLYRVFAQQLKRQQTDLLKDLFSLLSQILLIAKNNLLPLLASESSERLFFTSHLQKLVIQKGPNGVLHPYSYYGILSTLQRLKRLKVKMSGRYSELHLVAELACNTDTQKEWHQCISRLLSKRLYAAPLLQCTQLISKVKRLGIVSGWLNLVFPKAWKENPKDVFTHLSALYEKDHALFEKIQGLHQKLESTEKKIATPMIKEYAPEVRATFLEAIQPMVSSYKSASLLGKLATINLLEKNVDLLNRLMKAKKASPHYDDKKKQIADFATMLETFPLLVEEYWKLIPQEEEKKLMTPEMGKPMLFGGWMRSLREGFTTTFDKEEKVSKGFDALVEEAKSLKEHDEQQLEVRSTFNASSLLPTTKLNLSAVGIDERVTLPSRLEEYATLFHETLLLIIAYARKECGYTLDLVSKPLKVFGQLLEKRLNAQLLSVTNRAGTVKAAFNVPLREHSANIKVSLTKEGEISLQIECFGANEKRRWERLAAFVELLAHKGALNLTTPQPPKINYQRALGITFTLVSKAPKKAFVDILHFMLKGLPDEDDSPFTLLHTFRNQTKAATLEHLEAPFSQRSLYLACHLIEQFARDKNYPLLIKAAKGTLINLAAAKLSDYPTTEKSPSLKSYIDDTAYTFIPKKPLGAVSTALFALVKVLKERPTMHFEEKKTAKEIITALSQEPSIRERLPKVYRALKRLLQLDSDVNVLFKEFSFAHDFASLLHLYQEPRAETLKAAIIACIAINAAAKNNGPLFRGARQLYREGCFALAEEHLISRIENRLLAAQKKELAQIRLRIERESYHTELPEIQKQLIAKGALFNKNAHEILQLSAKALIGLSQRVNFGIDAETNFKGLENHFGDGAYSYVPENDVFESKRVWKAATLYMIRGLESKDGKIRKAAVDAVRLVITDYRTFARHSSHHSVRLRTIAFALSRAFHKTAKDKDAAREEIIDLWGAEEKELLDLLEKHQDEIPPTTTKKKMHKK